MSFYNNIIYYLHQYWIDIQDPRTKPYPLVDVSPWTIANIMFAYYCIVTKIGPQLMKNREPFKLREVMFLYNFIMVIVNAYFFKEVICRVDYGRRLLNWEYPSRNNWKPEALEEIRLGYLYWMTKFVDWFDTLFYVLRKKQSHISFLHLYHHISVPVFAYLLLKINPFVPSAILFIIVNSFIHCFMYSYYALSALGPAVQKYLWWKRYITVMQLSQFVIGIVYASILFFKQTGYPTVWFWIGYVQPPLFFFMFYDFYRKSYKTIDKDINKIDLNANNKNYNQGKVE